MCWLLYEYVLLLVQKRKVLEFHILFNIDKICQYFEVNKKNIHLSNQTFVFIIFIKTHFIKNKFL